MSKFNTITRQPRGPVGVITSERTPSGHTALGGVGYARDPKSELFLLAVTNFVGENVFHEDALSRDTRYLDLVRQAVRIDPQWTAEMLKWLRTGANMRTASLIGAIEAARELSLILRRERATAAVSPRQVLDCVLIRADEPGEALSYWLTVYGKPLPQWFKRALGDAVLRLYNEFTFCKWDSERNPVRFADVLEFTQISRLRGIANDRLFRYLLDNRHGRGDIEGLPLLTARRALLDVPIAERRTWLRGNAHAGTLADALRAAGMTWEAISGWLNDGKGMNAEAWEAIIPLMGYDALVKNLRNFDTAGISKDARNRVAAFLSDPARAARSRMLPMQLLNAYNNVPSDFWKPVLDDAATLSLRRVPAFDGETLILIDTSGSMDNPFTTRPGRRSTDTEQLKRWDAAALAGIALAQRAANPTVVSFSNSYWGGQPSKRFDLRPGRNLLSTVADFRRTHFINGGTDTADAVRRWYRGHDRVAIFTDEQAMYDGAGVLAPIPAKVPVYTFNLAGYTFGYAVTGPNRHVVGGLNDAAFAMMAALETHGRGAWPWQVKLVG